MIPTTSKSPSGYAILQPFLLTQGRTIERVLGDGNCLFRALSLQLTGSQDHHLTLRKAIARSESKIESFRGIHAAILNKTSFVEHVKNMAKTCVWGTSLEIIAVASIFQVNIFVLSDSYRTGKPTWLKYSPNEKIVNELTRPGNSKLLRTGLPSTLQRQWLEITYSSRCHFDSVVSLQSTGQLSPPSNDSSNSSS